MLSMREKLREKLKKNSDAKVKNTGDMKLASKAAKSASPASDIQEQKSIWAKKAAHMEKVDAKLQDFLSRDRRRIDTGSEQKLEESLELENHTEGENIWATLKRQLDNINGQIQNYLKSINNDKESINTQETSCTQYAKFFQLACAYKKHDYLSAAFRPSQDIVDDLFKEFIKKMDDVLLYCLNAVKKNNAKRILNDLEKLLQELKKDRIYIDTCYIFQLEQFLERHNSQPAATTLSSTSSAISSSAAASAALSSVPAPDAKVKKKSQPTHRKKFRFNSNPPRKNKSVSDSESTSTTMNSTSDTVESTKVIALSEAALANVSASTHVTASAGSSSSSAASTAVAAVPVPTRHAASSASSSSSTSSRAVVNKSVSYAAAALSAFKTTATASTTGSTSAAATSSSSAPQGRYAAVLMAANKKTATRIAARGAATLPVDAFASAAAVAASTPLRTQAPSESAAGSQVILSGTPAATAARSSRVGSISAASAFFSSSAALHNRGELDDTKRQPKYWFQSCVYAIAVNAAKKRGCGKLSPLPSSPEYHRYRNAIKEILRSNGESIPRVDDVEGMARQIFRHQDPCVKHYIKGATEQDIANDIKHKLKDAPDNADQKASAAMPTNARQVRTVVASTNAVSAGNSKVPSSSSALSSTTTAPAVSAATSGAKAPTFQISWADINDDDADAPAAAPAPRRPGKS